MILEAAVALYTGDLLPEGEAPWVVGWRERLRGRFLEAFDRLWRLAEGMGDLRDAERWAECLFDEEPTCGKAARFLIRRAEGRRDLEAARRYAARYRQACRAAGLAPDPGVTPEAWRGIRASTPLGRLLQALGELAREVPAFPVEDLRQILLRGAVQAAEAALVRGAYPEAAPWAMAALQLLTPQTPAEWAWRARCAVDAVADFEGDRDRQAANLRAMLRLARRMGDPARRARLELQRGRPAAAERLLAAAEAVLAVDPRHQAMLRRLRGLTALRRGWFPAARDHLEAALALLPEDAPVVHRAAILNGLAVAWRTFWEETPFLRPPAFDERKRSGAGFMLPAVAVAEPARSEGS
ncbi:bacterial transcriptional activator domain-containing protein [Thermoflexus sp.]|uniref:bacterial transcriptional activator domain-containing protein n=1 Tax=Thermoflexus sp. TaxID=1969742 RepID=UPI001750D83E|nr:bacterial transcriptional activator domain-containing protein [Thermoflexus sp.]